MGRTLERNTHLIHGCILIIFYLQLEIFILFSVTVSLQHRAIRQAGYNYERPQVPFMLPKYDTPSTTPRIPPPPSTYLPPVINGN